MWCTFSPTRLTFTYLLFPLFPSRLLSSLDCKAGKGRTGTLIAALLLQLRVCVSSSDALTLFGERRTRNGRGVTIPSQARFVEYYETQLRALDAAAATVANKVSASLPAPFNVAGTTAARIIHTSISRDPMWPGATDILVDVCRDVTNSGGFGFEIAASTATDVPVICNLAVALAASFEAPWIATTAALREGDVILKVASVFVRTLDEAAGALRAAASEDIVQLLVRRSSHPDFLARLLFPPRDVDTYWRSIAAGCGPWAQGSCALTAPRPNVKILNMTVSALPNVRGGGGGVCRGGGGGGGEFFWTLASGAYCRESVAMTGVHEMCEEGSSRHARWAFPEDSSSVSGDFTLSLRNRRGTKKALIQMCLHTAFLPLPDIAATRIGIVVRVGDTLEKDVQVEVEGGDAAERSEKSSSVSRPTLGCLYTAAGAVTTSIAPSSSLTIRSVRGVGSSSGSSGAVLESGMIGVATFRKNELDGPVKDRRNHLWPSDLCVTVTFAALDLPSKYK